MKTSAKKLLVVLGLLIVLSAPAFAQLTTGYVLPSQTDPALTNNNSPHFVALATNTAVRRGKLLLHLPGTDSNPAGATEWVQTAAAMGFHAIGLKYQNNGSMASICVTNPNLDCYEDTTDETVTGRFYADNLTNVSKQVLRADSIENRVQKLLVKLAADLPSAQNWGQFLDATNGVVWSNVVVSGHSQGGSCALFIAKTRVVDRLVLFATVDWIIFPTNRQPPWFAKPSLTPPERIYGFTHRMDTVDGSGLWQQLPVWQDLGITGFGPVLRVETNAPPFLNSHTLTSLVPPGETNENGTFKYHNSVITDEAAPRTPGGEVAWIPVWNYMLTNVSAPLPANLSLNTNSSGDLLISWPGNSGFSSQLEHSLNLKDWARLDLPAPEINAVMSLQIPPYLLDDDERFFRLVRQPLVTTPIPTTPGLYLDRSLVHGGIARKYYLSIPTGWNAGTNWPVMFVLPGHGQSIAEFASAQTELISLAASGGMILVFAEATAGVDSYKWFCYANPHLTQPYIDDAAFLLGLLEELKTSGLNVNTNRCYLAGFSNGGSMTHYMASITNHPFAAFAIMESGTAPLAHFREPYNRLLPDDGTVVPANIQLPSTPRPVMLMNMATSVPWPFEGRFPIRGARENVSRWVFANRHGAPVTNATLGIVEPPATGLVTNTTWTATGNDRSRVAIEDIRPDHNWPVALLAGTNGWTTNLVAKFRYNDEHGTNTVSQRLPEWVRTAYPHTISPDPAAPDFARVDSGTMTVEIWRTNLLNRANEVIFIGLSDGGHQWPNSGDKLPFNASQEILKFFSAH